MTLKDRRLTYELSAAQSGTITGDGEVEPLFKSKNRLFFWRFFSFLKDKHDGFIFLKKKKKIGKVFFMKSKNYFNDDYFNEFYNSN